MKKILFAFTFMFLCSMSAKAAIINQVAYGDLTGTQLIDFESLPGGSPGGPGTNYDGIIDLVGASFGERFNGQTLSANGNADQLGGTPVGGLTLLAGAANENLTVWTRAPDGNVLAGLGNLGFPDFNAIGEGAVSILFDNDQSEFGFQSVGGNLGGATFEFWTRDGSFLDMIMPANLGVDFFGFSREGGIQDIAGISIWNLDPAGIAFDDIRFDVAGNDVPVPEPVTLALFSVGLLGLGFARRRKT